MTDILKITVNIILGGALIVFGSWLLTGAIEQKAEMKTRRAAGYFKSPLGAFFASAAITAIMQSSSAVTVLTVSMASGGVLSLSSAMAAVYGANIGTTVTAQMMSLDITAFGPYMLAAGALLFIMRPTAGKTIFGFGLLLIGLTVLKSSALLIKKSGFIMNFIQYYSGSSAWCVAFGFITTALVHSSSATVGLTIALFNGGIIGFKEAALITFGDNIGTCVTAQTAAITGSAAGRRVAWGNMLYNVICAVLAIVFIDSFTEAVLFITRLLGQPDTSLIANAHTLINVLGAALFLPLNNSYCRLLERLIKET